MANEWYYARGGEKSGPVTAAQLKQLVRSGELARNDMVWKEGMAEWKPAGTVKGLFPPPPGTTPDSPAPPPLPRDRDGGTTSDPSPLLTHPLVRKVMADKLLLLGCCLGVSVVLTILVPSLLAPKRLSTFPPDILAEPGFENVKRWDDPRLEAEIDKRHRENTRNARRLATSGMTTAVFVLIDVSLVVLIGFVGFRRFNSTATDKLYDQGGPELPANYPWSKEEREASNPKLLWMKVGIGASIVVGVLCLASILGAIFCLPFFSLAFLIYFMAVSKGRLHARWVPVEGRTGWVEFLAGGIFKREDGTVGTFALLPNQKFIDILASGHLVDSWRVLAWGVDTLEVQDMVGVVRNFKKGKTLAEKHAGFGTDRNRLLQRKWEPVTGDGPTLEFTDSGAVIRGDGRTGKYTIDGDRLVIQIEGVPGETLELVKLTGSELVLGIDGRVRSYRKRQGPGLFGSILGSLSKVGTSASGEAASQSSEAVSSSDPIVAEILVVMNATGPKGLDEFEKTLDGMGLTPDQLAPLRTLLQQARGRTDPPMNLYCDCPNCGTSYDVSDYVLGNKRFEQDVVCRCQATFSLSNGLNIRNTSEFVERRSKVGRILWGQTRQMSRKEQADHQISQLNWLIREATLQGNYTKAQFHQSQLNTLLQHYEW